MDNILQIMQFNNFNNLQQSNGVSFCLVAIRTGIFVCLVSMIVALWCKLNKNGKYYELPKS